MVRLNIAFSLFLTLSVYASEEPPLMTQDIESLLEQTISAQRKEKTEAVSPARNHTEKQKATQKAKQDEAQGEANESNEKVDISKTNPDGNVDIYSQRVNRIKEILKQLNNPEMLLNELIMSGDLSVSPDDIQLLKIISDELDKAENLPFVNPKIINRAYMVDTKDRYKTYELFVHDTGETLIEFLDINGEPWPIWDHSRNPNYNVRLGEDHMLWIAPKIKYKPTNFFITLEKYRNPIQLVINYSNKQRHGLATFKVPYISPTSNQSASTNSTDKTLTLAGLSKSLTNSHGSKPTVTVEGLSYLATTGRFPDNSKAAKSAISVLVSDPSLAKVWMVDGLFVVRTPYNLYTFDEVINASGDMKVFVAAELNNIVTLNTGKGQATLYLPNYHQLVK